MPIALLQLSCGATCSGGTPRLNEADPKSHHPLGLPGSLHLTRVQIPKPPFPTSHSNLHPIPISQLQPLRRTSLQDPHGALPRLHRRSEPRAEGRRVCPAGDLRQCPGRCGGLSRSLERGETARRMDFVICIRLLMNENPSQFVSIWIEQALHMGGVNRESTLRSVKQPSIFCGGVLALNLYLQLDKVLSTR